MVDVLSAALPNCADGGPTEKSTKLLRFGRKNGTSVNPISPGLAESKLINFDFFHHLGKDAVSYCIIKPLGSILFYRFAIYPTRSAFVLDILALRYIAKEGAD